MSAFGDPSRNWLALAGALLGLIAFCLSAVTPGPSIFMAVPAAVMGWLSLRSTLAPLAWIALILAVLALLNAITIGFSFGFAPFLIPGDEPL
jgi:uncharacterized membrane protein